MFMTSAESSKLLRKLKAEYDAMLNKERHSCTFLASVGEDPESVRPQYDYTETKRQLNALSLQIRKLKHAVNLFNTATVIPEYGVTVDEMLVLIPQLSAEKAKAVHSGRLSTCSLPPFSPAAIMVSMFPLPTRTFCTKITAMPITILKR